MTRDASIDEGVCVMSIHTYTKDPIGMFTEKDTGNYFEYGVNDCPDFEGNREHYPHIVWVGGEGGMRHAWLSLCKGQEDCGLHHGRRGREWSSP